MLEETPYNDNDTEANATGPEGEVREENALVRELYIGLAIWVISGW